MTDCRFRDTDGQLGCTQPAEYEIMPVAERIDPDDYTYACSPHVGPQLVSRDGLAQQWSVYQLTPAVNRDGT